MAHACTPEASASRVTTRGDAGTLDTNVSPGPTGDLGTNMASVPTKVPKLPRDTAIPRATILPRAESTVAPSLRPTMASAYTPEASVNRVTTQGELQMGNIRASLGPTGEIGTNMASALIYPTEIPRSWV
jgi:hypothetical protein